MRRPNNPRDSVRARLASLSRLAIVAAMPVTNTACDPSPEPYCTEKVGADLSSEIVATAVWTADPDGDGFVISLSVTPLTMDISVILRSVSGATALDADTADTASALTSPAVLRPDEGGTSVVVLGDVLCEGFVIGAVTITVDTSGTPVEAGEAPTTVLVEDTSRP